MESKLYFKVGQACCYKFFTSTGKLFQYKNFPTTLCNLRFKDYDFQLATIFFPFHPKSVASRRSGTTEMVIQVNNLYDLAPLELRGR